MRVQAAERADWRAGEVQALVGLARGHADSPNAEDNTHDAPVCGLRAEALDSAITGRTSRGQVAKTNTNNAHLPAILSKFKQASHPFVTSGHATTFR